LIGPWIGPLLEAEE